MLLSKLPVTVFYLIQAELPRTELRVSPWPCSYLFRWLFVAAAVDYHTCICPKDRTVQGSEEKLHVSEGKESQEDML